jgi:hypothetical protein
LLCYWSPHRYCLLVFPGTDTPPCSSQDQLRAVVKKAGERARVASPQDLPAVVHQLLMLSTRGCRELILGVRLRGWERPQGLVIQEAR